MQTDPPRDIDEHAALLQRDDDAAVAAPAVRLHGGRPRAAEGAGALQRGDRLRHPRRHQQPGDLGGHAGDARGDRRRDARERQLLHRRSARPDALAGTDASFAGGPIDADPALEARQPAGCRTRCGCSTTACACWPTRRAGSPSSTRNDFATAFQRIQQDNSSYYVLGYYPTNDRRDGRFRKIEVKVNRPGLRGPRPQRLPGAAGQAAGGQAGGRRRRGRLPSCASVLASPLPVPGLRLTVTAAPFKGTRAERRGEPRPALRRARPDLQAEGRQVRGCARPRRRSRSTATGRDRRAGSATRCSCRCSRPPTSRCSRSGVRVTSRLDIPPGRYQLRVAAVERRQQAHGLGVLRPRGARLHRRAADDERPAAHVDARRPDADDCRDAWTTPLRKALPGPPTVSREFRSGEELARAGRGLRQRDEDAAHGGHHHHAAGGRRPRGVQARGPAVEHRTRRRPRRLRLHRPRAAEGAVSGALRAEGGSALTPGEGNAPRAGKCRSG